MTDRIVFHTQEQAEQVAQCIANDIHVSLVVYRSAMPLPLPEFDVAIELPIWGDIVSRIYPAA